MKKEIKSLTGLRGVAALYVAIYHWFRSNEDKIELLKFHFPVFIKHGYMSVDMFFILSGFVITLSSRKLFESGINTQNYLLFMKRRFTRVYPIYLIITLIAFVLLLRLHDVRSLLWNLALIQVFTQAQYVLDPSWSLSAEWFAYLLFPFIFYLAYLYEGVLWIIVCFILSFFTLLFISSNFNIFLNSIQLLKDTYGPLDKYRGLASVLRCFSEYLIGISLFKVYSFYKEKYSILYHIATIPCVFLLLVLLFVPNSDTFLVLLFAVLIISLSTDEGFIAKILSSKYIYILGEISYSLYLIHPIIISSQATLYIKLNKFHFLYSTEISYLIFGISLIYFSYLTHKLIEVPSRTYVKKKLSV